MHISKGLFGDRLMPHYNCLARSGLYLPTINPKEADGVLVDCHNPSGTNIITCRDGRIEKFLREVNGLYFDLSPQSRLMVYDHYMPVFDYRTLPQAYDVSSEVIGMTLADILISPLKLVAGQYKVRKISFRDAAVIRKLCAKKKVILFLSGYDVLIETMWHQRTVCELFHQLRLMGFWAVAGFNFSVFGGECPVAQHLNQKKSLVSSMLIEDHGLKTIPHIYAISDYHIVKYQQWLKANPHITLVTMNCQMQHTEPDIQQVVTSVQAMLIINPKLHIILQGYWFTEIHRFHDFLDRIHIAESRPVKSGQTFQHADPTIITRPGQYQKDEYKKLVIENVEYRSAEINRIISSI